MHETKNQIQSPNYDSISWHFGFAINPKLAAKTKEVKKKKKKLRELLCFYEGERYINVIVYNIHQYMTTNSAFIFLHKFSFPELDRFWKTDYAIITGKDTSTMIQIKIVQKIEKYSIKAMTFKHPSNA